MSSENPTFVSKADGNEVIIKNPTPQLLARLQTSDIAQEFCEVGSITIPVTSDQDKARIFDLLRQANIPFASGREWSPAEVFAWLRDRGLISGLFREIFWRGPGNWSVIDS